jgi:hypothetical protein
MECEMSLRAVTNRDHAKENFIQYPRAVESSDLVRSSIPFTHWWYAMVIDGEWKFAPSKFVGYRGMNAELYEHRYKKMTGTYTESVLREWFDEIDLRSELGRDLSTRLEKFANGFGKSLRRGFGMLVVRGNLATASGESDTLEQRVISAIVALAECLSENAKSELRRRIH